MSGKSLTIVGLLILFLIISIILYKDKNQSTAEIAHLNQQVSDLQSKTNSLERDSSSLLKQLVIKDYPQLENKNISDFEKVNYIRQWAFQNILWHVIPSLDNKKEFKFYSKNAAQIFSAYYRKEGEVLCGGSAQSLMKLYEDFGYQAYTMDMGIPGTTVTHVVVLVSIEANAKKVLSIQDPTFNLTYVNNYGNPFDTSNY